MHALLIIVIFHKHNVNFSKCFYFDENTLLWSEKLSSYVACVVMSINCRMASKCFYGATYQKSQSAVVGSTWARTSSPNSVPTTQPQPATGHYDAVSTFHDDDICKRAYRCSAPAVCNSLPKTVVKLITVTLLLCIYKSRLKTFLFSRVFSLPFSQ